MRILIADTMPSEFAAAIKTAGHDLVDEAGISADSLPDHLRGVEVLVVRSTQVTARTLERGETLRLVVRAGSGTNTIDCAVATRLGINVANVPGRNAIAVAELTIGLLLAVDRAIPDNVASLRAGRWDKATFSGRGRGLYGRQLGIVGLGHIGLEVAARAQAFGMRVSSLDTPNRPDSTMKRIEQLGIALRPGIRDLAAEVDVLSIHVPLCASTDRIVDRDVLDALVPGILINTSRAGVVDTDALLAHLDLGTLSAGLDVFPEEPTVGSAAWLSALAMHPRVVGTNHIGASTEQAQSAVVAGVLEIIEGFDRGELVNVVNHPIGAQEARR